MTITRAPAPTTTAPAPAPRRRVPLEPYLYLLPHALLFFVFTVYPIGYGLYISLHRWDLLNPVKTFVGSEFYRNLFTPGTPQADFFWKTLWNTTFFTVVSVPLLMAAALGLALLLHRPIFGRTFFRAVFFMPGILTVSVMGILWRWMFDNQMGWSMPRVTRCWAHRPSPGCPPRAWPGCRLWSGPCGGPWAST